MSRLPQDCCRISESNMRSDVIAQFKIEFMIELLNIKTDVERGEYPLFLLRNYGCSFACYLNILKTII